MSFTLGKRIGAATAGAALVLPLAFAGPANAHPDPTSLAQKVVASAVKKHLYKFQQIADAHNGNRAAGTSGYDASRDYVADQLRKAGYKVTLQAFEFPFFAENSPA